MFKEFKEFALKGNVIDMAVGVVIGGAFGKIVTSLVNDVIMPLIGAILGGVNFTGLKAVLSPAVVEAGEIVKAENALTYGNFIQTIVDFLIVAFCIFLVVRAINKLRKKLEKPAEPEEPKEEEPKGPTTEELLTEIRDLLKKE